MLDFIFPDSWRKATVDDVKASDKGAIVSGPFGSNIGKRFFVDKGIPVIRGNNLTLGDKKFIDDGFVFITEEKAYELRNCKAIVGDIVFTAAGTLGQIGLIPSNSRYPVYIISNKQLRLRCNTAIAEPEYLYYWFSQPRMREYIVNQNTGSSIPLITLGTLRNLPLLLPPLPVQRKIATVLSTYDDLIEVNMHCIRTLEQIAQAIYREWFGEVDAQALPAGWMVVTIGNVLLELVSGSRPKGGIDPNERGVPSIGAENIIGLGQYNYSSEKYVSRDFFNAMTKGHVKSKDVLLYKDGAQIGRKSLFQDGFPHEECCVNEHVFILRTNDTCTQNYLYFWLDQPDITQNIINLNANAAQPGINQIGLKGLTILLPDQNSLKKFDDTVEPILALLFNLAKKNDNLRRTRDLLLPRLVNGEIDVSGLDIQGE